MMHTPTPWVYDPTNERYQPNSPYIVWSPAGPGYGAIAETKSPGLMPYGDGQEQADNAAFIVRACNAHADLLAACETVHNWLVCAAIATPEDMAQSFQSMERVLRDAIAKAKL